MLHFLGGMSAARLLWLLAQGPQVTVAKYRAPWSGRNGLEPLQVCTPIPSTPWGCMEQDENKIMAVIRKSNEGILLWDSPFP